MQLEQHWFPRGYSASRSCHSRHTSEKFGLEDTNPICPCFIFENISEQHVSSLLGRCRAVSLFILVLFPNPRARDMCASTPTHDSESTKYPPPWKLVCVQLRIYQTLGTLLGMSFWRLIFPLKLIYYKHFVDLGKFLAFSKSSALMARLHETI